MQLTLGEFVDNIEKNGLEHIHGSMFKRNIFNVPIGACALGQGILNTFKTTEVPDSFWYDNPRMDALHVNASERFEPYGSGRFDDFIIWMNDEARMSIQEICDMLREVFKGRLDEVIWEGIID